MSAKRRFFIPPVIQSSAMDCGPAALKSLLAGFDIDISLGRLREACHTDVDGTSINNIEDLAVELGLDATQVLIPADHILLPTADALPALLIIRKVDGMAHFVVAWRIVAGWVQIMDPATGRHWLRCSSLQSMLYVHQQAVSAEDWLAYAHSDGFLDVLRARMQKVCPDQAWVEECIQCALANKHWSALACLDAATRMMTAILMADGISKGYKAGTMLSQLTHHPDDIPQNYWLLYPDVMKNNQLLFRSAVAIHIAGLNDEDDKNPAKPEHILQDIRQEVPKVEKHVFAAMRSDGLITPVLVSIALLLATMGITMEVVVFRGLVEISQQLHLVSQQVETYVLVFLFLLSLLFLEWFMNKSYLGIGRRLELRLRQQLLKKMPKLEDRYFHSRLTSDMLQRAYELRDLRNLPELAINFMRTLLQIMLVTFGLAILYPEGVGLIFFSTIITISLALVSQPVLHEQDMQFRTHIGSLSHFYLDSLLGLTAIRAHCAASTLRSMHDQLLVNWIKSGRSFFSSHELNSLVQLLVSTSLAVTMVVAYLHSSTHDSSGTLLLLYWMLLIPLLGSQLADHAQQYPAHHNRLLRLLEPLGAVDEKSKWYGDIARPAYISQPKQSDKADQNKQIVIHFHQINLDLSGKRLLHQINITLTAGTHVAIVGKSGAGKSSLISLLLGWNRPSSGSLWIDGKLLHGERLQQLRRQMVWVEPEVQIWNQSLRHNIRYGNIDANSSASALTGDDDIHIWQQAELLSVLEQLSPDENLGDNGGLLSGGEAQRVRLGRAMNRDAVRLVILDEPFRGLSGSQRRRLLKKARSFWQQATLMFISHDISDTLSFDRVLVLDNGYLVENANPAILATQSNSYYAKLLQSEREAQDIIWRSTDWRKVRLENGILLEQENDNA